jgi:predicted O-methyltransferase YrrM
MRPPGNVFACLVHERPECVMDLVRNLRCLDPESAILLYNGGDNPDLLADFACDRYGAICIPGAAPVKWGRLHHFALCAMRFALAELSFRTLTIVDSDQLALRPGYSAYLSSYLASRNRVGMLVNSPGCQTARTQVGPARAALRELDLWRPFLKRFPAGESQFPHWSFWPATVFTTEAARELAELFTDPQLQQVLDRSRIWASEEVLFPTLAALLGFEIAQHPCNYDYVRYKVQFTAAQLEDAWKDPRAYWMHSVPRKYDDPLRQRIRRKWNQYYRLEARDMIARPRPDSLLLARPVLSRMKKIEGWLEEDEADLLLAAAARVLTNREDSAAIVEIGSYCGRSTVVLGAAALATGRGVRVYAVDPHDGRVGAADTGIHNGPPTFEKFIANIMAAGLHEVVEPVLQPSYQVRWDDSIARPIAMLLIDGLHDYANVSRDFHHFEPWIVPGGYVAFHDYADYYPGVRLFVDELLESGFYELVDHVGSMVVLKKCAGKPTAGTPSILPESSTDKPLVSCILPTANRRHLLPRAIQCFLRQTYPNRELVVVDDGADPVRDLIPCDSRVRYVRLEGSRTLGHKRNLACGYARGEVLAHWDDDWSADWRLAYQMEALSNNEWASLCGIARVLFYDPRHDRAWEYRYPPDQKGWLCGGALCYRKSFWEAHPFPDFHGGEDTRFIWEAPERSLLALPDNSFFVGMVHSGNTSPKNTNGSRWHPYPNTGIHELLRADLDFYKHWAVSAK